MNILTSIRIEESVNRLCLNPIDNGLLSIGYSSGGITAWEWNTMDSIKPSWEGTNGAAVMGAFHPTGEQFAFSSRTQGMQIRSWNGGTLISRVGGTNHYGPITFSPCGKYLIGACSIAEEKHRKNYSEVYSISNGEMVGRFSQSDTGYSWHPDGVVLAVLSSGQSGNAVHFVILESHIKVFDLAFLSGIEVSGFQFSPDGKYLAIVGMMESLALEVVRIPRCELVFRKAFTRFDRQPPTMLTRELGFSSDSQFVFCPLPTGEVIQLKSSTGIEVGRWAVCDAPISAIDVNSRTGAFAVGAQDGSLFLGSIDDGGTEAPIQFCKYLCENVETVESTDRVSNYVFDFDTEPHLEEL